MPVPPEATGTSEVEEGNSHLPRPSCAGNKICPSHNGSHNSVDVDRGGPTRRPQASTCGIVETTRTTTGCLSAFWSLEVGSNGEEGGFKGPAGEPPAEITAEEKSIQLLRTGQSGPQEDRPDPLGTFDPARRHKGPQHGTLGRRDSSINAACGGADPKPSAQVRAALGNWSDTFAAIDARIKALEDALVEDCAAPARVELPFKWVLKYSGEVKLEGRHEGSKPTSTTCTAPLAPIATSTLNAPNLFRWATKSKDEALKKALSYLLDDQPPPFELPPTRVPTWGSQVSRNFSAGDLTVIRSISEPATDTAFLYEPLGLFKVPKKDGRARLVQDGRPLNRVVPRPPPMDLPAIDAIIARAQSHPFLAQADATSFFYQMQISRRLRPLFSFNVGEKRGRFETRMLCRLPMGFSHAPFIAQAIANGLCRYAIETLRRRYPHLTDQVSLVAWIDNFIVQASSEAWKVRAIEALRETFSTFNVQVGWLPSQEILGLCFSKRGVRLSRAFVEKALTLLRDTSEIVVQKLMRAMGCIIWAMITTIRSPLAADYPLLLLLQEAAQKPLDATLHVSPDARQAMARWRERLRKNPRFLLYAPESASHPPLWSDASSQAAALCAPTTSALLWGRIPLPSDLHIFYKELLAAYAAVLVPTGHPEKPVLLTDNLPLAHAIAKGHSTRGGAVTNKIIAKILERVAGVGWVPTNEQVADCLTRDPWSPPQPTQITDTSYHLMQSYFLPGGRGGKERRGGPTLTINNKLQQISVPVCVYG